ncbi:LOW QUALITY PROTEIN: olfactory receptor 10A7 [Rhynchonycteris naso]
MLKSRVSMHSGAEPCQLHAPFGVDNIPENPDFKFSDITSDSSRVWPEVKLSCRERGRGGAHAVTEEESRNEKKLIPIYFFFFGSSECFLLSMMAYDHFVAICSPLRYSVITNRSSACGWLVVGPWMSGVPASMLQTAWIMALPFCGPNTVEHFFCDGSPLLKLVTETTMYKIQALASTLFIIFPFSLILVSYTHIITTIMRMPSATGYQKAFSTCSSHLTVVSLFYGTASLTYLWPRSSQAPESKKLVSLFYTVITPMLNPIIYSLRNNELKGAVNRTFSRKVLQKLDVF